MDKHMSKPYPSPTCGCGKRYLTQQRNW